MVLSLWITLTNAIGDPRVHKSGPTRTKESQERKTDGQTQRDGDRQKEMQSGTEQRDTQRQIERTE